MNFECPELSKALTSLASPLDLISRQLARIEEVVSSKDSKPARRYYSTGEAATLIGLSKWYVRRLCAVGVISAKKHPQSGRFMISARELEKFQSRSESFVGDNGDK